MEACHFINDNLGRPEDTETAVVLRAANDATQHEPILPLTRHATSSPDPQAGHLAIHCRPYSGLSNLPFLKDSRHGHLLSYYCEQLCPLTVTSKRLTSPFYSLVLPFCTSASTIVSDALLALSARHLSRMDDSWTVTAIKLEHTVLRGLRHRLATAKPSEIWQDHELPVVIMLICLSEILNRCDSRWTMHLKGARDLIRARRGFSGRDLSQPDTTNELTHFSERFFAFQDVIGRTACGEPPIFGSDYWDASDTVIDAWLGCSPALVSIVFSLAELSRSKAKYFDSTVSMEFTAQAAMLESSLSSLQQVMPTGGDDGVLLRSANIKLEAAKIYLHCALYGANPRTRSVKGGVREVLRRVSEFLDEDIAAGLVWPLFVAAVELDPLDDELWKDESTGAPVYGRPLVLRLLQHMGTASIANVTRAREVICRIWDARDKAMIVDESTISASSSKPTHEDDWDRFVAPLSRNISLA